MDGCEFGSIKILLSFQLLPRKVDNYPAALLTALGGQNCQRARQTFC